MSRVISDAGWRFVTVHFNKTNDVSFWVEPDENVQAAAANACENVGLNPDDIFAYTFHPILEDGTPEPLRYDSEFDDLVFGPQEPPDDSRIFNRRQPDGTLRPLSEFFDSAVA